MNQHEYDNVGGNIENSLQGLTKLNMPVLAKEAWNLSQTRKGSLLQGSLLIFGLVLLCIAVLEHLFEVQDWAVAPPNAQLALQIVVTIITAPLVAAMFMTGISHSVGERPAFSVVLKRIINSALVIFLAMLVLVIVYLGSALFILPGIYLGFATGFSMMLYVEKQLSPGQAILQSIRIFNRYWTQLSLFYVGAFVLFIVGLFTFGIAYIWIIPFYFNMKGVLYRELFGIKVKIQDASLTKEKSVDSIFHA
ncbi:MAG: hypothetical protein NWQ54_19240 [Paraglaciecola sp.]|uniref:hypothetical protein n=1 Tax=Pseudomonadati TaxID=3379134 RepID=UPI00273FC3DC|nr:hypothetical protein [Paraglaciecola sp.]MDP5029433.1 hypothetical protein [Paraglaciecola sp.]MDP5133020.1 hypothetical protein [Paraglaciecola sp.]